jgi:hypothetical protein
MWRQAAFDKLDVCLLRGLCFPEGQSVWMGLLMVSMKGLSQNRDENKKLLDTCLISFLQYLQYQK